MIIKLAALVGAIGVLLGAGVATFQFVSTLWPKTEWVNAHGASCEETCTGNKLNAVRLGKYNNDNFYLCSAKLGSSGAAFNGGVQSGKGGNCRVQGQAGGGDYAPADYRCLCTNPPLNPPS